MTSPPRILTTTVGSYPIPDWLTLLPTEQTLIDATRVVFDTQRQCGIDLPTDGELYRFDVNHPDTNGMIDHFVRRLAGIKTEVGWRETSAFRERNEMRFRRRPAGVVTQAISPGSLNLPSDCERARDVAGGRFKFTITSPYMLARTILDEHYRDFPKLVMAIADVIADQMGALTCDCVQIDEANIPGNVGDASLAAQAMNRIFDQVQVEKATHLCFGNYGGQTIQQGSWAAMVPFLNSLHCNHLILEMAHRAPDDLQALRDIDPRIALGVGVVDVKINHIETPDEIAAAIQRAEKLLGLGRVRYVHPDCGLWMLKRSVADRKLAALARGRDLYLGRA